MRQMSVKVVDERTNDRTCSLHIKPNKEGKKKERKKVTVYSLLYEKERGKSRYGIALASFYLVLKILMTV